MEMIIVIVIIMVIMMMMGGITPGFLTPQQMDMQYLAANQWNCAPVVWSAEPAVHDGLFEGTVEMDCNVMGIDGRGMGELRQWLIDQMPRNAWQVHSEPEMEVYAGLPGLAFDVTVRAETEKGEHDIRGISHIATNGFTELRSVFESTEIPSSTSKYIKGLRTEVNVKSSGRAHWFKVNFSSSSSVQKPWGISNKAFISKMKSKIAEDFKTRSETMVTAVSNHL